jgi:hypothetical protein
MLSESEISHKRFDRVVVVNEAEGFTKEAETVAPHNAKGDPKEVESVHRS